MNICKFGLSVSDEQPVWMPKEAQILSVDAKHGLLCMWALCDSTQQFEYRRIAVYGTGTLLPSNVGTFIGTVLIHGGALVWHVFDITVVN